ncbi:hypothetical protein ACF061_11750 [Streptomyces sp. NPDC015220]|uniref:hypothetical protein n=1 Tax=Streptomyces sp. NPDC015220 TaxID=3364947 RepID=UPI0036F52560
MWRARPPALVAGNPTGAGDAAVAALALRLTTTVPWPRRLAEVVALSAAAVAAPLAGDFGPDTHRALLGSVIVRPVPPRRT